MLKAFDRRARHSLFCTAPVGVAGSASLDLAGAPAPGEMTCLIIVVSLFFFAGYCVFARWGKTSGERINRPMPAFAR